MDIIAYMLAKRGGGGGGGATAKSDVNFYDYDGTVVKSYSASDFAKLSAMPENPTHAGLTAQGWNWSLADAQTYVAKYGMLNIGQMYITDDGKTRLYITIATECRMSPTLYFNQTVANGVTINWGDGSTTETVAGTGSITASHTYASTGSYVITLDPVEGCILGLGSGSSNSLIAGTPADAYRTWLQALEIGGGVTSIGNNALYSCYSLTTVAIPNSVTSIGGNAFNGCYSLTAVTIPDGVTSINGGAFSSCRSLLSIAIPNGVTSMGGSIFNYCDSLLSIAIPDGVTSIDSNAFYNCDSLSSVTIPNGVTSIGSNAFYSCYSLSSITIPDGVTSIRDGAFYNCYSLSSVTIPDGVTSIDNSVFTGCTSLTAVTIPNGVTSIKAGAFFTCFGMGEFHLLPTTPPTLPNTSAFYGAPNDCVFYVPAGTLADYKAATNWSNYASYMVEEAP